MRNEEQNFEEKISGLLGSLKRIEAPGDFDFKVRARIAKGRPPVARSSWLPASVKLAVPLGLILAVGVYFGFIGISSSVPGEQPRVAAVAVPDVQPMPFVPVAEEPVTAPAQELPEVAEAKAREKREIAKPAIVAVKKTSTTRRAPESEGGSVDSAARETKSIFPVGVVPNADVPVSVPNDGTTPVVRLTGKDVLARVGVSAVFVAGRWRVSSVNEASSAGKAGLQTGDVIEAVNGSTLSDKAVIEPGFAARGLRVRRDGRIVFIGLTP